MQNLPSATLCTALHPPLLKASLQIAAFQVHPDMCIPYMCRAGWLQHLYLFFFCNSGLLKVYVFRSICFCCVYISGLLKRYVYIPDPGRTHSGICVCCVCDLISGLREGLNKNKNVFFRALPESPPPPPLTPIRATWSSFFGRQNSRFESQFRTKDTIYTIIFYIYTS